MATYISKKFKTAQEFDEWVGNMEHPNKSFLDKLCEEDKTAWDNKGCNLSLNEKGKLQLLCSNGNVLAEVDVSNADGKTISCDKETGVLSVCGFKEKNSGQVFSFWAGTQAEFNKILVKNPCTYYWITDDATLDDLIEAITDIQNEISKIVIGKTVVDKATHATTAISANNAFNADHATTADSASNADSAKEADVSKKVKTVVNPVDPLTHMYPIPFINNDEALKQNSEGELATKNSVYFNTADNSMNAPRFRGELIGNAKTATKADSATTAETAAKADSATTAETANKANSATTAQSATIAQKATTATTANKAAVLYGLTVYDCTLQSVSSNLYAENIESLPTGIYAVVINADGYSFCGIVVYKGVVSERYYVGVDKNIRVYIRRLESSSERAEIQVSLDDDSWQWKFGSNDHLYLYKISEL